MSDYSSKLPALLLKEALGRAGEGGTLWVVVVAARGSVMVALLCLTTAGCFLVRVWLLWLPVVMELVLFGLFKLSLPYPYYGDPTRPALTMATRIAAIRITNIVILARSLARRAYYRGLILTRKIRSALCLHCSDASVKLTETRSS